MYIFNPWIVVETSFSRTKSFYIEGNPQQHTLFTENTLRLALVWHGRWSCSLKGHRMSFDQWLSVPTTGYHSCTMVRAAMLLDSPKPRQANVTFPIQHVLWHLRICPITRPKKSSQQEDRLTGFSHDQRWSGRMERRELYGSQIREGWKKSP